MIAHGQESSVFKRLTQCRLFNTKQLNNTYRNTDTKRRTMKNNKLLILLGFLLTPMLANAQWTFDNTFLPDTANTSDLFFEVHGVAVDPDGKVWVQPFSATETIITARDGNNGDPDTLTTRVVYVYNADGTPASFSPLSVIEYADGTTPNDTLGQVWTGTGYEGYSGRGIEASVADGNIIISQFNRLYKIDYKTGKGLAMVDPTSGCSLGEATTDAEGNIYVGCVVGTDAPIYKYDSNLENEEVVITTTASFSRDLQVSADGQTIWWAGYTNGFVLRYQKPDEFSGFATPDTVLRGIRAESFDLHPKTKHLWVGAGSLNDVPDAPYTPQTWYAFDYDALGTESEEPLDSIRWSAGAWNPDFTGEFDAGRPRALDFEAEGTVAYVGVFSGGDTPYDVQKFTTTQVYTSNEDDVNEIPEGFKLGQNYPNPFNPTTNINYTIDQAGLVTLRVYDITGREVATLVNNRKNAGDHTVTFDATNLASGVYIYTLQANGVRLTNRMTLIK